MTDDEIREWNGLTDEEAKHVRDNPSVLKSAPTPEERAATEIAEYINDAWLQVSHLTPKGRLAFIEVCASRITLAAVEAEREACWQAVLALSSNELRAHESATADVSEYGRHLNRHSAFTAAIAAIRARGDATDSPP
jgi:hypothetical protein